MTVDEQFQALRAQYLDEVLRRMHPESRHKWYYVCLGWAMGKGLSEQTAELFVKYMKY